MQESDPKAVAATAATLLEYWLTTTPVRQDKHARPIVFQFLVPGGSLAFSFAPAAEGPLIREGVIENAAATVRTHPRALLRLLVEPGYSPAADMYPFWIDGDPTALEVISRALASRSAAKSIVGVRLGEDR